MRDIAVAVDSESKALLGARAAKNRNAYDAGAVSRWRGYPMTTPSHSPQLRESGRLPRRRAGPWTAAATVTVLYAPSSAGSHLSEAYTADLPGAPVQLYSRAFSLGNMPTICGESPVPSKLVPRDPIRLRVGQRIERIGQVPENSQRDVIVDAYDEAGMFLSHVPIRISVNDPQGILVFRSDGDYVEAVAIGEASLVVTWACGPSDGPFVQAPARVIVTD